MKSETGFKKCLMFILLVLGASALVACTADTLQVGIEPTSTIASIPTPVPTLTTPPIPPRIPTLTTVPPPTIQPTAEQPTVTPSLGSYTNGEHGFSFQYPPTWTVQDEHSHAIQISQGSLSLRIGFMWIFESVDIWGRTGLPAGDFETRGTVTFLGQELSREVLAYEGRDKAVFYSVPPLRITAEDLVFSIVLEDLDTDYLSLEVSEEMQIQADQIVESFDLLPSPPPVTDLPVVGWYGSVHGLPAEARFDDYLSLLPEGAGEVGLVGASPAVESQIEALRDQEEPNKYAHFWGTLSCGLSDYGGCQLLATHLRPDGPGLVFGPDPVEGWEGTIVTNSAWAQIDDAFVLAGDYPVHYGVWSEDSMLTAQIEGVRNSGLAVQLWGQITCGIMDANGCQIQVFQLDIERGTEELIPSVPTEIKYVMALEDVTMHNGPGEEYAVIGGIFGGQAALVTGVSADEQWWQVICPDDRVGNCWISADPSLTGPTTLPSNDP